jgi:heat shock protein HslJ
MLSARWSVARLALAVALFTAGCARGDDNANGGLAFTDWSVTAIDGVATIVDARPTLSFAPDGTLTGSSGCNRFSGSFRTDGDRITIGQLAMTEMGCEPDRMAQEAAFGAALSGVTGWRQTEAGRLELDGAAHISAEPGGRAEAPTADPEPSAGIIGPWALVDLGTRRDLANLVPTATFLGDGTMSGFAGCNTFRGTYELDADRLILGPLATTKMACQGPASAIEADYLAALGSISTWQRIDRRLLLGGPVPLTFAAG